MSFHSLRNQRRVTPHPPPPPWDLPETQSGSPLPAHGTNIVLHMNTFVYTHTHRSWISKNSPFSMTSPPPVSHR